VRGCSSAMTPCETVERVRSGDVDLLVRKYGRPGGVPVLLIHGANYHDSLDWSHVAEALSDDREVAVYDNRGYGASAWSENKDYTIDANVADVIAVMDDAGWDNAVLAGAARGAAFATLAGSHHPARVAATVLIDWIPNTGIRHPGRPLQTEQSVGNEFRRFPSPEAALEATTRSPRTMSSVAGRERFLSLLSRDGDAYILSCRDPDFQNPIPLVAADWPTAIPVDVDLWKSLAEVTCPIQYVEALRSDIGILPEERTRLRLDYPHLRWDEIDAGNDLAAEAPEALARVLRSFLVETVDHAAR
jgi:pimeloyl-ACP methyl ester carboxylesterase